MSFDTLNQALAVFTDGNGNKWYRATVITNVDPLNLDRIQVSLPGHYDPNLGPVPWVGPMKMSPFGFGSGYGVFGTPVVGSDVMVSFQNGDPHYPLYMHIQCYPNPSEFPSGQAWGFKDPQGNALVVQGKDIQFKSGSGFQIHIDASGNFTVTSPSGSTGTWNVPHVVFNVTDFQINGSNFNVSANTNINGVTVADSGNTYLPSSLVVTGGSMFGTLASFNFGFSSTGTASSNGHDISYTHKHLNQSGATTGIVST